MPSKLAFNKAPLSEDIAEILNNKQQFRRFTRWLQICNKHYFTLIYCELTDLSVIVNTKTNSTHFFESSQDMIEHFATIK